MGIDCRKKAEEWPPIFRIIRSVHLERVFVLSTDVRHLPRGQISLIRFLKEYHFHYEKKFELLL